MRQALILVVVAIVVMGCQPKHESNDTAATPPGTQTFEQLLIGNWARFDCQAYTPMFDKKYGITFNATQMIVTYLYYNTGTNCTQYSHQFEIKYDYSLFAPTNPAAIAQIDLLVDEVKVTPGSSAAATAFNNSSYLGHNTWANGVPVVFTSFGGGYVFPEDDYTIIQMANSRLYWGDYFSGAGTNPGNRPTVIDPNNYELRF